MLKNKFILLSFFNKLTLHSKAIAEITIIPLYLKKIVIIACWGAVGHLLALVIAKLIHLSSRGDVKLIYSGSLPYIFLNLVAASL